MKKADAGHRACKEAAGVHPSSIVMLSSRLRRAERRVLFGRARLFADRVMLTGWTVRGRYRRCVSLSSIASFEYHLLEEGSNLTLFLIDGRKMDLHVDEAHRWRECFEQWLQYDVLPSAKLLGNTDQASAQAG